MTKLFSSRRSIYHTDHFHEQNHIFEQIEPKLIYKAMYRVTSTLTIDKAWKNTNKKQVCKAGWTGRGGSEGLMLTGSRHPAARGWLCRWPGWEGWSSASARSTLSPPALLSTPPTRLSVAKSSTGLTECCHSLEPAGQVLCQCSSPSRWTWVPASGPVSRAPPPYTAIQDFSLDQFSFWWWNQLSPS